MNELWRQLSARANVILSSEQAQSLQGYLDLLLQANEQINLTRISGPDAAQVQHVGDALTLLEYLPAGPIKLVDVGSGGGVPGIPLAIARPDMSVTLIESTKKKAAFLTNTAKTLNLKNVIVIDQRAEKVARTARRESFDVAAARAVGTMDWLAEWCLPLVKRTGKMLAMKGAKIREELPLSAKAIKILGGGEPIVHPVQLPGTEHHVIVEIPKVFKTDPKFPRNPTMTRGKAIR
ncbi:MAG TPA: 16S rRNA (guanine(527)-N(7))-methyltransferase RsmG [Tepidisphaeraceae bacterium]|nr:16S rRNA (guanine(527)-N(7))-methyltransferase RsmG [Tepidisphaeraceae bacterium]